MDNQPLQFIKRFWPLIAGPLFGILITWIFLRSLFFVAADPAAIQLTRIEIAQGKTLTDIARELKEKGILNSALSLRIIARLKGVDTRITAGEYELSPSMTPKEILQKLASGEVLKRRVTVREGITLWEIGDLLEQAGVVTKSEFTAAATDRVLIEKAGLSAVNAKSFEGYLFPETYFFSRPITAEKVLWTMLEEGEKHWPEEFTNRADELRLTRHDVLTLASIVERETGSAEEMPMVSSVFHNRLKQGMRLQSDPTVIYGIPNFNGNITRADLETPSPYNTYLIVGLPPGPIGNPGEKAVRAALYPAETAFLYFVSNNQGSHIFSTNLKDHNDAVARYQSARSGIPSENAAPTVEAAAPAQP